MSPSTVPALKFPSRETAFADVLGTAPEASLRPTVSVVSDRIVSSRPSLAVAANPVPMLAAPATLSDGRLPGNLCADGRCGPESQRIWNAFQAAGQLDFTTLPHVFSGDMHWMMSGYDQNDTHHAGVLIDRQADGSYVFKARFAFFGASDPYANATIDEARAWSKNNPVQRKGDYVFVDSNPRSDEPNGGTTMRYWLRQDPKTRNVYLIAFWGGQRLGFGELHEH